ncbi:MAG: 23S rRNA (pseudouridine(1915)-N(3))-methyltransferase RlmH [Terriglobales bacterium]
MKLTIAWIGKTKDSAIQELTDKYLKRLAYYVDVEGKALKDETKLLALGGSSANPSLIALDRSGKQLSSEDLAGFLRKHQEGGSSHLLFAVGAADGFGEQILQTAAFKLSLGKMTLSHELARIVLLEQLYRAFTILKGHPYHIGH